MMREEIQCTSISGGALSLIPYQAHLYVLCLIIIPCYFGEQVVFEVTRGSSYTSDVALDDIFFQDGKCGDQGPTSTVFVNVTLPLHITSLYTYFKEVVSAFVVSG